MLQTEQAALLKAISAVKAQADAADKQKYPEHEKWNTPTILVQVGLLVVGTFYTLFACFQLAAFRREVRIMQSVEAPFLTVIMEPQGFPPTHVGGQVFADYWFQNEGRTPAILKELCAELVIRNGVPALPEYDDVMPYKSDVVAIGPNTKGPLGRTPHKISDKTWQLNGQASSKWLFYGYVKYSDVLAKAETTLGFGYYFDRAKHAFLMIDDFPYNYRSYHEKRWYHYFYKK